MSKKTDFKQQLEELEHIVEWFESEEVDIDQALEKFERGMELASNLEKQLSEMENKVQEITQKFNDYVSEKDTSDTEKEE